MPDTRNKFKEKKRKQQKKKEQKDAPKNGLVKKLLIACLFIPLFASSIDYKAEYEKSKDVLETLEEKLSDEKQRNIALYQQYQKILPLKNEIANNTDLVVEHVSDYYKAVFKGYYSLLKDYSKQLYEYEKQRFIYYHILPNFKLASSYITNRLDTVEVDNKNNVTITE